jgi:hypothetical protein
VEAVLERVIANPGSAHAWLLLLAIPKWSLAKPKKGGWEHRGQTSKIVKDRLQRLANPSNHTALWNEALKSKTRAGSVSKRTDEEVKRQSVINYAQNGRYSKAAKTLASLGMAKPSTAVLEHLQDLHPAAEIPSIPQDPTPSATTISEEQVQASLRSFPEETAPGPSSFRAAHFKEAVFCPGPAQAARTSAALTKVVNLLAGGAIPSDLAPIICSSNLFAFNKKDVGSFHLRLRR